MKAMVFTQYGPPEVLQLQEVDKPVPQDDEVLVKVHAASVNYGDLAFVRGKPFVIRLMGQGLLKPKTTILGADIAGEVEAVGAKVEQFQPGDAVFGDIAAFGFGGYAELFEDAGIDDAKSRGIGHPFFYHAQLEHCGAEQGIRAVSCGHGTGAIL